MALARTQTGVAMTDSGRRSMALGSAVAGRTASSDDQRADGRIEVELVEAAEEFDWYRESKYRVCWFAQLFS